MPPGGVSGARCRPRRRPWPRDDTARGDSGAQLRAPACAAAGAHVPSPAAGMVAPASAGSSASSRGVPEVAVSVLDAPSPALDHELRLQDERVGSTTLPSVEQSEHDQLERAPLAASAPVAAFHI